MMQAAQASPTSSHQSPATFPHWRAVALWLGIELLTLLIPVTQTPLTDQFPRPAERQALYIMVAAQLAASALLFPLLWRSAAVAVMVIAASWPMLVFSGLLASAPGARIVLVATYVSAWLVTLALWTWLLTSLRAQLAGVAIAASLVLGGPMLRYLRAEFGAPPEMQVPIDPIGCAFALIDSAGASLAPWWTVGALAATAMLLNGVFALRRRVKSSWRSKPISAPGYPQPDQDVPH